METREIRLKGGPYDNAVFATGGRDITFAVTEVGSSDNPDAIDIERYRYVETQETDDAGRRIFKYKPRAVSKTIVN